MSDEKILHKLAWPIIAPPAVNLALIWNKLPESIALHYNLQSTIDRYGHKKVLILLAGVLIISNALVYLLLTNIHLFDPNKYVADNKDRLERIALAVVVFLSALLFLIIYSSTQGNVKLPVGLVFSGVGLLFAVIGNYMPNMKPNYLAGFRLPWILENSDNWKKTHALGGRLWFGGGLLIAVICLFTTPVLPIYVFFTIMTVITIIPCVYSHRLYKKQKRE